MLHTVRPERPLEKGRGDLIFETVRAGGDAVGLGTGLHSLESIFASCQPWKSHPGLSIA